MSIKIENVNGSSQNVIRFIGLSLLLIALYSTAGYLSLKLAIPPGFATGIFPPSGIALAFVLVYGYKMVPAVFLGSFLLNIFPTIFSGSSDIAIVLPGLTGAGAALQALVGALLVKRLFSDPFTLIYDKPMLPFFIIAAPLSCLISASCGVSALFYQGLITEHEALYSWWTWFVGDSIGVMIALPITYCYISSPTRLWKQRRITVALPLVMSCTAIIIAFFQINQWEINRLNEIFETRAKMHLVTLQSKLVALEQEIISTAEWMQLHLSGEGPTVSQQEQKHFLNFSSHVLKHHPNLKAVGWLPLVPLKTAPEFENWAQKNISPTFEIRQKSVSPSLPESLVGDSAFPVTLITPPEGNEAAVGFDIYSAADRRIAINSAIENRRVSMTQKINLVQGNLDDWSTLVIYPIFDNAKRQDNTAVNNHHVRGLISAVANVGNLFRSSMLQSGSNNFNIEIDDLTSPRKAEHMLSLGSDRISNQFPVYFDTTLDIYGRKFNIAMSPSHDFIQQHGSIQAWSTLAGGLIICGFMGIFLLSATGRNEITNRAVDEKTKELRSVLDSATDAIIIFNKKGELQNWNKAAEGYFPKGHPRNKLLIFDILPTLRITFHHKKSVPDYDKHLRIKRNKGTDLYVVINIANTDMDGEDWYTLSIHDITEESILNNTLLERQQLLDQTGRAAHVGGWKFELKTNELTWTDETYRIHEYSPEVKIKVEKAIDFYTEESKPLINLAFENLIKTGESFELELQITTATGKIIDVKSVGHAQTDISGNIESVFGIIQDITELKKLDELKTNFLSTVSHELRTPLTAMLGSIDLVKNLGDQLPKAQQNELIDVASRNCTRLLTLVNDLLDFQKINSGQLRYNMKTCQLYNDVIQPSIDAMTGYSNDKNIIIQVECDHAVQVYCDPERLTQVMLNLLSNAIKFSPPNSNILITAAQSEEQVDVLVVDEGSGIPADKLEAVFNRFSQVDDGNTQISGGTGLGLAISKSIVEAHGGSICAMRNDNEVGTTFKFSIPNSSAIKL